MRLLASLLIFLTTSIFANVQTPPMPQGTYSFTKKYELTGCAEYSDHQCKKHETRKFAVNDQINVYEFFFDDKTNRFSAKYVHLKQFRSIPLEVIKLVRTSSLD